MEDLAHLLRVQKYHKRTRRELQRRLNRYKTASDTQRNILLAHPLLQKSLAECIRTGDKATFNSAYDSLQQSWIRYLDVTHSEHIYSGKTDRQHTDSNLEHPSILERLSYQSRDDILHFLTDVITNKAFLLERLMALDKCQLEKLHHEHRHTEQNRSVLAHSTSSPRKRVNSPDLPRSDGKDLLNNPNPFHHSPLAVLFDIAGSFPVSNTETVHRCQEQLWATICAQMLTETRPGRERFIISALDCMARQTRPIGNAPLEIWIKQTLRDGQFLIAERDSLAFSNDKDIGKDTSRAEAFYLRSIRKLFLLLREKRTTNLIPRRILNMCQTIVSKLRNCDTKFRSAPFFFLAHWLFANYLPDAIIIPESLGLMLDEYLTDTARHRILRETIMRAQRIVVDVSYSWNHTGAVDASLKADVEAIADQFRPVDSPEPGPDAPNHTAETDDDLFLRTISASDIRTLVHSLYPDQGEASTSQLSCTSTVFGTTSVTSSIDGLSFFRQTPLRDNEYIPIPGTGSDLSNDSNAWPVEDTHLSDTISRAKLHAHDEVIDLNREAALHAACIEMESVIRANVPPSESSAASVSLLGLQTGRITILDGAHVFGLHDEELKVPTENDTNEFRLDSDRSDAYLQIRKSVLKLVADSIALEHELSLANRGLNSACEDAFPLSKLFEMAIRCKQQSGDFTAAFEYTRALDKLETIFAQQPGTEGNMFRRFMRDVERSIARARHVSSSLTTIVSKLEQQCLENDNMATHIVAMAKDTRAKMWYCTDARTSSVYANLQRLADALRNMSNSPRRPKKRAEPPTLRHKGTLKPKNLNPIQRGEASVLDIMVTDPAYRVECKLKDEQATLTKLWMKQHSIENVCVGEERLHRLLCEISKCLGQLVNADPMVSPVLWGSELFQRDRLDGENEAFYIERTNERRKISSTLSRPVSSGMDEMLDFHANVCQPSEFSFGASSSGIGSFASRSPTLRTRSSTSFWSPSGIRSMSPMSNVSSPSRTWSPIYMRPAISREAFQISPKVKEFLSELRSRVSALVLSDIIQVAFPTGSETDNAFFPDIARAVADLSTQTGIKNRSAEVKKKGSRSDVSIGSCELKTNNNQASVVAESGEPQTSPRHQSSRAVAASIFDIHDAKRQLIRRFELTCDPSIKMQVLCDLETLLITSDCGKKTGERGRMLDDATPRASNSRIRIRSEDVIPRDTNSSLCTRPGFQKLASVDFFESFFSDPSTRPAGLFRDLQTIASLVPTEILDGTQAGRAFWSATAAALNLKQSITQRLVESADSMISQLTKTVGHDTVSSSELSNPSLSLGQPPSSPNGLFVGDMDQNPLMKAFKLLHVAASQSHPVAQRELSTLYLTHWEQLPRVLAPFASCAEVFRANSAEWAKERHDGRQYDAETMCVALHWMQLSAAGGDALAKSLCDEGI